MEPWLSVPVERALEECGRHRILHRWPQAGLKAGVAIRSIQASDIAPMMDADERYVIVDGDTHDEAGRAAALKYAKSLRTVAERLTSWAVRIETALR